MNNYDTKQQTASGLPAQLKTSVEAMSGFNMDDVRVHYNSSKPAQMKALAYTQGTDIHVAPGQEQHLGHEAWHVVQQKQGRVAPTTQLKGMNINTNSGLEHEADVMGAKAASYTAPEMPVVQRKTAATSGENAPMQFWGLDQHEALTMSGAELAGITDEEELKSLQVGAILNDVYENSGKRKKSNSLISGEKMLQKDVSFREQAKFGLKFKFQTDSFINETHHGGMQFLHTMSNDESAAENYAKQVAWAQFCLELNAGLITTNTRLADYVMAKQNVPNDKLFEMLMPMMVEYRHPYLHKHSHKKTTFPSKKADGTPFVNARERADAAYKCITTGCPDLPNKKRCKISEKGKMSVSTFFGNADKQRGATASNFGMIAIGTVLHMLEDSFAGSHSIRSINLNHDWFTTIQSKEQMDAVTEDQIVSRLTRIIVNANYNNQDEKKHGQSDKFDKTINFTQGAAEAKVVVACVLKNVKAMNAAQNMDEKRRLLDQTMDFIKRVLLPEGVAPAPLANPQNNTMPISVDMGVTDIAVESSGRAYDQMEWVKLMGTDKKKLSEAQVCMEAYQKVLERERGNHMYTPETQLTYFIQEAQLLASAYHLTSNDEAMAHIIQHMNEIEVNATSMKKQLRMKHGNDNNIPQKLRDLLERLFNEIARVGA